MGDKHAKFAAFCSPDSLGQCNLKSKQTSRAKRCLFVFSDYHMIMDSNPDCLARELHLRGHVDVRLAWCGVAGWMVVHQNHGTSIQFQ